MSAELIIQNGNTIYEPAVQEGITWSTERSGSAGKLTFKCMYDAALNITEGNAVRLKWDGKNVFYGFIFEISRNKDNVLSITAYDQLRYFKNKDTYVIEGKTAGEVLQMMAKDFNLQCGTIDDTKFKIASLTEDNKSLWDIMGDCLDKTLMNAKEMYVMYDDFGKIALQNIANLKRMTLIQSDTAQNYDYKSSIDNEVYDKVKLFRDNKETGQRDIYIAQDGSHINEWGVLQYYDKLDDNENGQAKADAMLALYNMKTKTMTVKNAIGDVGIRAGCLMPVIIDMGVDKLSNFMLVESCTHTFKLNEDWMDLKLAGNGFTASSGGSSGGGSSGGSSGSGSGSGSNSSFGTKGGARIGHASTSKGAMPNQVTIRAWYSKPWNKVLRPNSASVGVQIASACEAGCNNDKIGYSQAKRTSLYSQASASGFNLGGISTTCYCDCSSFVAVCVNAAGVSVSKDMTTSSLASTLTGTGQFTVLTDSKYTTSNDYLLPGDILLAEGKHTAMVLDPGSKT